MVVHMHNNKGLANVVALIMVLIVVIVIAVPFLFLYTSSQSYRQVSTAIVNNYQYLRDLQIKQVTTGHPAIYYNSSIIILQYTNGTFVPPSNLTITNILYLNQQGVWIGIPMNYPIVISTGEALKLPSYVNGRPIIIVTSLGNIFFLTPGSSIGPFALAGSKGGVEILTQISNSSLTIGVSTNITTNIYGKWNNFTTPVAFPNTTGTFEVKVPIYVYYENSKGQIITGVFRNWYVIGEASLNSTTSQGVKATLQGRTAVLIANYTPLLAYVTLKIQTNFPGSINISIDGKTYTVTNNQTITIPAGFVNVTVLTLQANYTAYKSKGIIQHYSYSSMQYSSKTINTYSTLIFIPPSTTKTTLDINYIDDYNYYLVNIIGYYNEKEYGELNVSIGTAIYSYNSSYWFIGGNYSFNPIGIFVNSQYSGNSYTYYAAKVIFSYSNGTLFNYTFPNLPGYVIINQPMIIEVNYSVIMYWQPLQQW